MSAEDGAEGKCNMPSPSGSSCPYCMGATVYEMRAVIVRDGCDHVFSFRYCLNHLRRRIAVGLIDGRSG
jgi:hypothetical protein